MKCDAMQFLEILDIKLCGTEVSFLSHKSTPSCGYLAVVVIVFYVVIK